MSLPVHRATTSPSHHRGGLLAAAFAGTLIGAVGGLIGLGGAEFRLPLLIAVFGFVALDAVIVNKAISLVVVSAALLFRTNVIPFDVVLAHWPILANLLAGSLLGAWLGADVATRLSARTLYRVIAVLLVAIAALLVFTHDPTTPSAPWASGMALILLGVGAGFIIGVIASLLGVAGGELLIPTLVLLFGVDIAVAGSLSLAVSLPTMLVGFARYSRDRSFDVLRRHPRFVLVMALGSIAGAFLGAQALAVVPHAVLPPLLAVILLLSAVKIWCHR
jgi:uncharacterized membrane protein YfcA